MFTPVTTHTHTHTHTHNRLSKLLNHRFVMCNEIVCAHAMLPTSCVIQRLLPSVVAGGIFNIVSLCGDKQNLCNLVTL